MPSREPKKKVVPPSADQIVELTEAVITLTEQVRCLRLAVDEIEQELGWAIRTKVLDRLPRPQFPCDERLWPNSPEEQIERAEHVSDEPAQDGLPADSASNLELHQGTEGSQRKLW